MLQRNIYDSLKEWKERKSGKKCLVVRGARQVGKTYIVERFGENEYDSFIEINFLRNPGMKDIFSGDLDANSLIRNFSLYKPDAVFTEGKTLLFIDEIQECPEAVTSLKFWAEDGRFDVIASGSMLGIDYKRPSSYPVGYVDYLDMTALDFHEFLKAMGVGTDVLSYVKECFEDKKAIQEPIHKKMMEYLRMYMVLGGMPEVVNKYLETGSMLEADNVQRRILTDYRYDIAHYASAEEKIKAESCYLSIPVQLGKANHKFQYSVVEKGSSGRKYKSSVEWLCQADLAVKVCNNDPLKAPISTHIDAGDFRIYCTDIGLYTAMMDYSLKAMLLNIKSDISSDTKGGCYEALIAEMLYKAGHKNLCFTKNQQSTFEIEFVLETEDGLIPVEVKSGKSKSRSLDNLLKKDEIAFGYKLIDGNAGISGKKITLPLYMAQWI